MAREKRMPGNVGGGRRGGAFEKPKGKPSAILIRLWKYLYHYKWMLLLAATLSIGGNLLHKYVGVLCQNNHSFRKKDCGEDISPRRMV